MISCAHYNTQEEWKSLYEEFAMSNSETDKVSHNSLQYDLDNHALLQIHALVIKMLMAGLDLELIDDILTLSHSVVHHSLQVSSLIREALETLLSQLRYH